MIGVSTALVTGAVLGAAASVHCIGMCGPLVASGCARGSARDARASSLSYLLGRTTSYVTLGAIAGMVGRPLVIAASASRTVQIGAAAMAAVALFLAGLHRLRNVRAADATHAPLAQLGRPRGVQASGVQPSGLLARLTALLPKAGLGLGLATGIFPCGVLAAGLLSAAATGSSLAGAAGMLAFAVCSAPLLMLPTWLGVRAAFVVRGHGALLRKVSGIGLLVLAGWTITLPALAAYRARGNSSPACHCHGRG